MKVFICLTVAQEVDGKNLFVRVDKASKNKDFIDKFIAQQKGTWIERIKVSDGEVNFACERHPHEIEVEE